MASSLPLDQYGIHVSRVLRNLSVAELYEHALRHEAGTRITSTGALAAYSGEKTGRSPADKRVVEEASTQADIWWGSVNIPLSSHIFDINLERAQDYLDTRDHLYVVDAYAGWSPSERLKVRVICARAYHALFMHNMLIRPTPEELASFGEPDFVVLNAGGFPANRHTPGMSSKTSVDLSFDRRMLIILGTQYAGEMKKGVFTVMNYLMPKRGILSMHCSATESLDGSDTSILFGLSGTGKTTLSADPERRLIGDDEHCWSDNGIFNIEGGCYAKTINLSEEAEPEIYGAVRFGTILENVHLDPDTRSVDFTEKRITENTRASYPIEYIRNAKVPCTSGHPKNVIFLTCDAFGVLPPVSRLSPEQAMYHFISGYTAKVAGTEMGVKDPEATFSPCFGGPFLAWHPTKYATLLRERLERHHATCWLVNTGWSGGAHGTGSRIPLRHTRAIVRAIHSGELARAEFTQDQTFGVEVPTSCPGVPQEILSPKSTWSDPGAYDATARKLAQLFVENFRKFADHNSEIQRGGPQL